MILSQVIARSIPKQNKEIKMLAADGINSLLLAQTQYKGMLPFTSGPPNRS